MIRERRQLLFIILLLGSIFGPILAAQAQEAEQPNTLEVIGTGVIYRDNVAKARDDAIEHSLWNAVEEGVDSMISPASVLSHFQLLNDRVYSHPDQFIHDYKVLTESKAGRYYRVIVRTSLLQETLKNKLQDIGVLMTDRGMPSIVFLLSEQNVGEVSSRVSWGQDPLAKFPLAVEDTLSKYMRDKGFIIVNPGSGLFEDLDLNPEIIITELSDDMAIRLAAQLGADVVVTGTATARLSGNVLGTDMKSVEATMDVRALRVNNQKIVGAFKGSGGAVHANEMVSGTEALTIAASNVAGDLSQQIAASWGRETRQTVLVELLVQGIDKYVDFVKFRRILKKEIRGIKNVYLRAIKAGEATMDVDLQGDTRTLADELMLKSFEGFGVNIFEVAQNAIKLEFIPKPGVRDELSMPQEPISESWQP